VQEHSGFYGFLQAMVKFPQQAPAIVGACNVTKKNIFFDIPSRPRHNLVVYA